MTESIAFLAYGAAGDVMYATPILREVRRIHPDAHISWFVRDKFSNLVETNPNLDAVKVYVVGTAWDEDNVTDLRRKELNEITMWQQMKDDGRDGPYDIVMAPQQWPDHDLFRSADDIVTLMAQNAGLTDLSFDRSPELKITPADRKAVDQRFPDVDWNKVVTINHVSYAAGKVWTEEQYSNLSYQLWRAGLTPMFTGLGGDYIPDALCLSTGDERYPMAMSSQPHHKILDARDTTYREWTECIRRSCLWFGLDTGAASLAACTDTPIIKLHSPTFPLSKTGIKDMKLRFKDVLEITTVPSVDSMVSLIKGKRRQ